MYAQVLHNVPTLQSALRKDNRAYFDRHPELNHMVQAFFEAVLDKKPERTLIFAGRYFCSPNLRRFVKQFQEGLELDKVSFGEQMKMRGV